MAKTTEEVRIQTLTRSQYLRNFTAIACEVLARRVTHHAAPDRLTSIMSTRFRHTEMNGETSDLTSALELAIDTNWHVSLNAFGLFYHIILT